MTVVAARVLAAVLSLALMFAVVGVYVDWRHNDRLTALETEMVRQAQVVDDMNATAKQAAEVVQRTQRMVEELLP
jgi:hypothetical protein